MHCMHWVKQLMVLVPSYLFPAVSYSGSATRPSAITGLMLPLRYVLTTRWQRSSRVPEK